MSEQTQMMSPINWQVATKQIGEKGLKTKLTLETQDLKYLEKELEIRFLREFICNLEIIPLAKNRFEVQGEMSADFEQSSAVSLNPLPISFHEEFASQFWPISQNDPVKSPELDLEYADEIIEFYEGETLNVGQLIYEQFVINLELFPRADGEVLEWEGDDQSEDKDPSPFDVLKNLKT